jgi:para-aminobenzoate synthetase
VCSSSPERFLSVSAEGLCDSKPIKGTRRRGASAEEDADICQELRSSEKDLAENLMIVDLVRNDFGRVCTEGSVCCPKIMDVETYATVHQLVSTIQGHKKPHLHTIDVVRATFPMGSMTGAPKRRSLALLDALESDARGIYSGAIGFLSLNGAAHFAVAIRTAVVTDTGVKVGAGGAITVLSDARDEWDEMQLKASVLLACAHAVASSSSTSSFALPLTSPAAGAAASEVASSGMA